MKITLPNALSELGISAYIKDNDYDSIVWTDPEKTVSKADLEAKVAEMQSAEDAIQYQRDRARAYTDLAEQFDLLWHAIDGGKFNVKSKDTDFYKKLKAVKDANPKPE